MPRSQPTLGEVERQARDLLDGAADRALPEPGTTDGSLGVALVRGGDVARSASDPSLGEVARRLREGDTDPETGVGYGYVALDGRRLPNTGTVGPSGVATLRDHGCRLVERDATAAYSLAVVVPVGVSDK